MKTLTPWLEAKWYGVTRVLWHYAPHEIVRFLPGTSRQFGPARHRTVWSEYRQHFPTPWRSVYAPTCQILPEPFYCNDDRYTWRSARVNPWPEFGVAEFSNGRLLDENGWVVGANDQHVRDFDLPVVNGVFLMNRITKLHPIRQIPGRTLNLSTIFGVRNFFHHVVDGIGRLHLSEKAGYTWDDFDHVILSRFESPMARVVEKAAGIPKEKIIRLARRDHVECETLIQPSYPGKTAHSPWWVGEFFRKILPPPTHGRRKRVYIPREGTRNPTEILRIEARLESLGFERVDPMNAEDLHEKLPYASHIVAVHGAALANIILCRPGTRLIELMPSDIAHADFACYYYTLCTTLGMPYAAVVGQSTVPRRFPFSPQSNSSFDIPWMHFERGLEKLLA